MKKNRPILQVLLLTTLLASCGNPSQQPPAPDASRATPLLVTVKYKPDELLVKLKPGADSTKLGVASRPLGAISAPAFRSKALAARSFADYRWQQVTLPANSDLKATMKQLLADPNVEAVEPNYLVKATAVPNDPEFPNQWALLNVGQSSGVPGADIGAVAAWDVQTGDPSVVVAVLDTGINETHPDLAANLWTNPAEISGNGIDDDGNGYVDDAHGYDFVNRQGDPNDDSGHGTAVSGVIAAVGNNGAGISGVAWNARIMALKALDASGSGYISDIVEALMYADRMGARIANASFGGYIYSQALRDAISVANDAGVLFVAAAGNDDNNNDVTPFYPASYDLPNVASVAATTSADAKAGFSNYGKATVHLGAPGQLIFTTAMDGAYSSFSGTSLAAPHVTGAAVLLLSQTPSLTPAGLKALLLDRSTELPAMFGITSSGGRLNVNDALSCDPAQAQLALHAPAAGFAVLEGEPTLVRAQVSACGQYLPGYQVTAVFSNGDPDLTLFDDGAHGDGAPADGIFGNYWVPQNLGEASIGVNASTPGELGLSQTASGTVRPRVRYQHETAPYVWIDASPGTAYALSDNGDVVIPIGFDFNFYGLTQSSVTINANGLLAFGAVPPVSGNTLLPNPAPPNNLIAPYWDDLYAGNGSDGPAVYTLLEGTAPNRRLTIEWFNVLRSGAGGGTLTFEATLYESSNDIVFNYQNIDVGDSRYDSGASAVVGVEDPDGLNATEFSAYQPLVQSGTAQRFYIVPAEPTLLYKVTVTTMPLRSLSGTLVMSLIDGDLLNDNYASILQFGGDGAVLLNPRLNGDASGSLIPGPAHLGDAGFVNEILQQVIFGDQTTFQMSLTHNGSFAPVPDTYAFYLLDEAGQPYPTSDPLGTDALFAIEIDSAQPDPQIFTSDYATVTVETVGAPTARPGGPYTALIGAPVQFDGSASTDPDGKALTYAWDFGDGVMDGGVAPTHAYASAGTYTVSLVVDNGTLHSAKAVTTTTITTSIPPVADAGPDQTVDKLSPVTLSGAASYDSDGTIVAYSWQQTAGPAVALSGADTVSASFTAPNVTADTTLTFQLTVTDNSGDTGRATVNVTVRNVDLPPVAGAGADQTVNEGAQVTLSGAGSSDPDGSIVSYEWAQISGPGVSLSSGGVGAIQFTAPSVATDAVLVFQLTVTDDGGATASDTVSVTVRNIDNPVANAGPDQVVNEGSAVTLSGSGSDPDGTVVGYAWTQIAGIAVSLNGADTATASFTAPMVNGDSVLTFELTVTDNSGLTGSDTVNVTVRNVVIPPIADAGPDQTVDSGSAVILDGGGSHDSDGTVTAYAWEQTAGPTVSLNGADTARPTFTAPTVSADAVLTFSLRVTDNDGATASDTVNVTVRKGNLGPIADAGPDQSLDEGTLVTLDGSGSNDPDGGGLTYQWIQTGGPQVTLSDATAIQPTFTAPSVNADTALSFTLKVIDGDGGLSSSDSVVITVREVGIPPTADAGPDQTLPGGATVTLDGAQSSDTDGTIIQYQWTQLSGPSVILNGANTATATFVAPSVATTTVLEFSLTVTDNSGDTANDSVMVTVFNPNVDNDNDGLPDGWEIQYFGNLDQGPNDDPDGDGLTNLQEFRAGTNPTVADPAPSTSAQVAVIPGDGDTTVVFSNVPAAARYDLYWSTSSSLTTANGTRVANVTSPYLHTGRVNGTTYYYLVVAANNNGEGPASTVASGTPGTRSWGTPPELVSNATVGVDRFGTIVPPDLAVDGQGNAVVVYTTDNGSGSDVWAVGYSRASGWQAPVLLASAPHSADQPKVSMNTKGDAVAIWRQYDGTRYNLWSSMLSTFSAAWSAPVLVEIYDGGIYENGDVNEASVSMGEGGLMVAVWTQDEARFFSDGSGIVAPTVYASVRTATSPWVQRRLLDVTGVGISDTVQVSADGAGGALFAWIRTDCPSGGLFCNGTERAIAARYGTEGWTAPTVLLDNGTNTVRDIRVGANAIGNGVAVYSRMMGTAKRPKWNVLANKFSVSTAWDVSPTVISSTTASPSDLSLTMRQDGRAVEAWNQSGTKYANFLSAAGTWSGTKSLTKTSGSGNQTAMDSRGKAQVVWGEFTDNVYSSIVDGTLSRKAWSTPVIAASGDASISQLKIKGDPSGNTTAIWVKNGQVWANRYFVP